MSRRLRLQSQLATGLNLLRRETIHVASSVDAAYLPHFAALAHSLIDRQRTRVHLHLVAAADVTPEMAGTLRRWVKGLGSTVSVHRIDERRLGGAPRYFSLVTWYRLLLPELLPELDRVLYLDPDTLVTDSIDWLWRVDLGNHCVAAVTQAPPSLEWMERHCAALGVATVDDFFQAGVMLMNLGRLRAGDWIERILDHARAHVDRARAEEVDEASPEQVAAYARRHPERLLFQDMDSINAILWPHRLRLHPRWHYMLALRRFPVRTAELTDEVVAEAAERPAIWHFEGPGPNKPWHPDADPDDKSLYWSHRRRTPWPG